MKHIYIAIIALFFSSSIFATRNTAVASKGWSSSSAWDLKRIPFNGDTVVIPAGITITVQNTVSLSNVVLQVNGRLAFDNGKLVLDSKSAIVVNTGASIYSQSDKDLISIGGVNKLVGTGRNITISGPVFANSSTGTAPNGFTVLSTLPVTFNQFTVSKTGSDVLIAWATSNEINNNNFEVQRSFDGSNWSSIAVVMGAGNSTTIQQYKYTDKNVQAATVYYRVRQVDIDGNFSFTAIKSITNASTTATAKIYSAGKTVRIEAANAPSMTVRVFTSNGQLIAQQNFQQVNGTVALNNFNASTGIYVVQATDGKGWMVSTKVAL
jgi:hypothetical protein